jgi:hypothetical protein
MRLWGRGEHPLNHCIAAAFGFLLAVLIVEFCHCGHTMKRPHRKDTPDRKTNTGDIKKDLSVDQLAQIGAMALAFNEVEKYLELLFFMVTDLSAPLQYEVSTRINGIDGKIGIIKIGLTQFRLDQTDIEQFNEALGKGVFKLYKSFRDAVIHVRVTDGSVGMGLLVDRQAQISDVLLSETALSVLYDHLVALKTELEFGALLLGLAKTTRNIDKNDPNAELIAKGRSNLSAQFQARRTVRLALPPIPEFPSESELDAAATRWHQNRQAAMPLMDWIQPWTGPVQLPTKMSDALHQAASNWPTPGPTKKV